MAVDELKIGPHAIVLPPASTLIIAVHLREGKHLEQMPEKLNA
jgi:hypothetical protein